MSADLKAQIHKLISAQAFDKAQVLCRKLCNQYPGDAEALFLSGSIYGQIGDYAAAEEQLTKALALAPDHAVLLYNLGVTQFQQNKFNQAIESFSRSVQINPNQFDAWVSLGRACEATNATEHAIKAYGQALSQQPESELLLHALGIAYMRIENWPEASICLVVCLQINRITLSMLPTSALPCRAHINMTGLITLMTPIALEHPTEIAPNFYVAMSHIELGELDEALTFYNRILEIEPDHPESIVGIAQIYNFKGQY